MSKIDLRQGDCLELMKDIPDGSVDMILADLPYGTTGVAAQNTNRNFILIEQEPEYVEIIKKRLELNKEQLKANQ